MESHWRPTQLSSHSVQTLDVQGVVLLLRVTNIFLKLCFVEMAWNPHRLKPRFTSTEDIYNFTKKNVIRIADSEISFLVIVGEDNTTAGIEISHSKISRQLILHLSDFSEEDDTTLVVSVAHSHISYCDVRNTVGTSVQRWNSLIIMDMFNVTITNSHVYLHALQEFFLLFLNSCSFLFDAQYPDRVRLDTALSVFDLYHIQVRDCFFNVDMTNRNCTTTCGLHVKKKELFLSSSLLDTFPFIHLGETTLLENTSFVGSAPREFGGNVVFEGDNILFLAMRNCVFTQSEHKIIPSQGTFLFLLGNVVTVAENITFNATGSSAFTSLLVSTFGILNLTDVYVLCPNGFHAVEKVARGNCHFLCDQKCEDGTYSLQLGSMTLHGERSFGTNQAVSFARRRTDPVCHACPTGAQCAGTVKPLPDYWGFRDGDHITMFRCPTGYCCTNKSTCENIDSCSTGRTGTLCGVCQENLTESLFDTKCIPAAKCQMPLILFLYILSAQCYAVLLLSLSTVKETVTACVKKIHRTFTERKRKGKRSSAELEEKAENETDETEGEDAQNADNETDSAKNVEMETASSNDSGSGMKYMQILLYYVQDASLFKVNLPDESGEGESMLVSMLQFSPEFLKLHGTITTLCFSENTSAVTKVVFTSAFGPLVMLLIALIYLVQKTVSKFLHKPADKWMTLKANLLHAFLLTLLFSYQKIVSGAFSLIQCIEIGNKTVLYEQANIQCYTWWQIVIQLYVFCNAIPVFFAVSHLPFKVETKALSPAMFVAICLLPAPYIVCHIFWKTVQKTKTIVSQKSLAPVCCSTTKAQTQDVNTAGDNSQHETSSATAVQDYSETEVVILHTLLHHYRKLEFFGISFTWLAVHKIYRLLLVACYTYTTDSFVRICTMTAMLLVITTGNSILKPYSDHRANTTATLSFTANICVAVCNMCRAGLVKFSCLTNCSSRPELLWYLALIDTVLLKWVPVATLAGWAVFMVVSRCLSKSK